VPGQGLLAGEKVARGERGFGHTGRHGEAGGRFFEQTEGGVVQRGYEKEKLPQAATVEAIFFKRIFDRRP
jgi:hypothetical protein